MNESFELQVFEMKKNLEYKIINLLENSEEIRLFMKLKRVKHMKISEKNKLIILKQYPKAELIAKYQSWKNMGYTVKKGERAIKILIPTLKRKERMIKVYDISQMVEKNNKPVKLPIIDAKVKTKINTQYNEKAIYEATKQVIMQKCNVVVDEKLPMLGCTNGIKIYIKDTREYLNMARVLIHEYVHYIKHYTEEIINENQKEVEAELGSVIYGAYFNLDVEELYKVIAVYSENINLQECFESAYKIIEPLIKKIEEKLNKVKKEKT